MNKKIVWDLFGGGQNSVYQTLKENNMLSKYEVYTFDITRPSHDKQFNIDLTSDNIVEIFKNYPKPHIITASPLCQSFSSVLTMKNGGTCFWKLNNDKTLLIERSVEEFEKLKSGFTKNLNPEIQLKRKRIGQKCIDNVINLIDYYKPKYWYIENPKRSLMWKYITLNKTDFTNYYFNHCTYSSYGFYLEKPTTFLSNVKMNLKNNKNKPLYELKNINGKDYYVLKENPSFKYPASIKSKTFMLAFLPRVVNQKNKNKNAPPESGIESAIPHKLLKEIFLNFEKKENTLF